jgi:alpha 1,6-mannosyltransferase
MQWAMDTLSDEVAVAAWERQFVAPSQDIPLDKSPVTFPTTRIPYRVHQQGRDMESLIKSIAEIITFDRAQSRAEMIEHTLWTDEKIDSFVKSKYPEYYSRFREFPHHIYRSDLARYMILNALGGLYSDTDTTLLKDYDQWVPRRIPPSQVSFIVGIEQDSTMRLDWHKWYARPFQWCQWTFASVAHHPILERAIQESFRRLQESPPVIQSDPSFSTLVMETTGPGLFTDSVFWYLETRYNVTATDLKRVSSPRVVGDILILPQTSFSPGLDHSQSFSELHPFSFVKHHFSGSWKADGDSEPPNP